MSVSTASEVGPMEDGQTGLAHSGTMLASVSAYFASDTAVRSRPHSVWYGCWTADCSSSRSCTPRASSKC